MKLARISSLLTGIVFACHFSAALAEPITDPAGSAACWADTVSTRDAKPREAQVRPGLLGILLVGYWL
jgi:hypothetical protein